MPKLDWFDLKDFACSCGCGQNQIDPAFVVALDTARGIARLPFIISSGYRCPEYDAAIGGKGNHPTGKAADIRCSNSGDRMRIVRGLIGAGFGRIEIADRHVHADMVDGKPESLWVGKSV